MAKKAASFAALGGLVFSTDAGRHCPDCRQPVDACTCKQTRLPEGDGIARVRRESKGTGGALKDGIIEIQGDHVDLLLAELVKQGFKAKKSGG